MVQSNPRRHHRLAHAHHVVTKNLAMPIPPLVLAVAVLVLRLLTM
jgi:hypothetical protein